MSSLYLVVHPPISGCCTRIQFFCCFPIACGIYLKNLVFISRGAPIYFWVMYTNPLLLVLSDFLWFLFKMSSLHLEVHPTISGCWTWIQFFWYVSIVYGYFKNVVFIYSCSPTYFWVLYMNPIPLVGVVLGQPDSHLCQLPLVLILLHQFNTTQSSGSGMFIRYPGCSRFPIFFPSRQQRKRRRGKIN